MYSPIDIPRNAKYGNNYWITYSPKLKRNVRFFSDLEYDNWILVEMNPSIICFCEQPLKISVQIEDRVIESIFDMWVLYEDNTEEFIEVKYACELDKNNPKSKRSLLQTSIQKEWCEKNNYKYSIKTDIEIRKNLIHLNNVKKIVSQVKNINDVSNEDIKKVISIIDKENVNIRDIVNKTAFSLSYVMQLISWLAYKGICFINIEEDEISFETEVYFIGKA